jgi:hypothetical protein
MSFRRSSTPSKQPKGQALRDALRHYLVRRPVTNDAGALSSPRRDSALITRALQLPRPGHLRLPSGRL